MKKKKTNIKTIIRQIVREEVAMAMNETAQDDGWKTMGGGQYTSDRMNEVVGKNYGDMMNGTQPVPSSDPMSQFLNKDYSQVLEKSIEKSKNKLGR